MVAEEQNLSTKQSLKRPMFLIPTQIPQTPLIDTRFGKYSFAGRVEALLGVCFNPGPGGGEVSPLCNKTWAGEKATESLNGFRLPRGAQRLAKEPSEDGGLLRSAFDVPGTEELVDKHRFWRVHLPLAAVEAFVKREHHAAQAGSGSTGGPGVPLAAVRVYRPSVPNP